MRWIPLLIVAWVLSLLQMTLGRVVTVEGLSIGPFGPDVLVVLAVLISLQVRSADQAALAGALLGFLVDLTTAGGLTAPSRVGPMAIGYAVAALLVFSLRDAIFRDRLGPQMILAFAFCLIAHGLWVTIQSVLAPGLGWHEWARMLLQVLASSACTAGAMLVLAWPVRLLRRWIVPEPPRTQGRSTRPSRARLG
jgi:rod shape-determining protein MreD